MNTYYQHRNTIIPITFSHERLFWVLFFTATLFSFVYTLLIGITIHSVVERKNFEKTANDLSMTVSELESQYLELQSKINLAAAKADGFSEISDISYISRTRELSMRTGNGDF